MFSTQNIKDLSAEAQELIRISMESQGGYAAINQKDELEKVDVAKILRDRPELMKGLNEYLIWRDSEMTRIAETKTSKPMGHAIRQLMNKIFDQGDQKK